jgi:hypothetical protein
VKGRSLRRLNLICRDGNGEGVENGIGIAYVLSKMLDIVNH